MRIHRTSLAALALGLASVPAALGQVYFSDAFDVDSSASWTLAQDADTSAIFRYDYSADGIPSAPNSGGSTFGLKLAANMDLPAAAAGLTAVPSGLSLPDSYVVRFDMWINVNGPFPGGGAGSTEFVTVGVAGDGASVLKSGSGTGVFFAVDGEGGSSTDFRSYLNGGVLTDASGVYAAGGAGTFPQEANNAYYHTAFPGGQTAPDSQVSAHSQQTGGLNPGTVGMSWHQVEVVKDGQSVQWSIDGLTIATVSDASLATGGQVGIGYWDAFSSVSDNPALSFGLVDNVRVEAVPEPATVALLVVGAGALGLGLRRRR